MGLLAKLFTGKMAANVVNRAIARREAQRVAAGATARTAAGEYIPAGQVASRGAMGHGALLDRATQIYQKNPKLIAGIATLAAAAVLAGMKRKPH